MAPESVFPTARALRHPWMTRWTGRAVAALAVIACWTAQIEADAVRVRPTAVVDAEKVTLGDICDLSQLSFEGLKNVEQTTVMPAPPPGGSTYVTVEEVQDALRRAGVNLATAVVTGATKCAVSRPQKSAPPSSRRRGKSGATEISGIQGRTLRDAVRDAFDRWDGSDGDRIDLQFGRTSEQILNLTEPQYTFDVRVKGGRRLGRMINVDVDVLAGGKKVQTVHLVVNASVARKIVVARRAINQNATVRPEDVKLAERIFERPDDGTARRMEEVIGQRARRFIAADRPILMSDLELVPLVHRGQIVDVVSMVGRVEARSVAKALGSGGLGDVIELRAGGRRGDVLAGIVIGQRRVMVGSRTSVNEGDGARLALGAER